MEHYTLKALWLGFLGWISSVYVFFMPLYNWWLAITILWCVNFAIGYYTGMRLNGEKMDKKKAGIAILELIAFLGTTALFLAIGKLVSRESEMTKGLYVATLAFVWYFSGGLFKNISRLCPRAWPFKYMYYLISFEFSNLLPKWKEFSNSNKAANNGQTDN